MTRKEVFKMAHEMTKKITKKGDDYKANFTLCLKFAYKKVKEKYTIIKRLINPDGFINERRINITGTMEECQNYLLQKVDNIKEMYPGIKIHMGTNCIYTEREFNQGLRRLSYTIKRI